MEISVVGNDASPASAIGFRFTETGAKREGAPPLVWGHGWGHTSAMLAPIAEALGALYFSTLVDFPGSNGAPPPPKGAGTAGIADALAAELKARIGGPVVWIGHSFGCRIGLQLASRHPDLIRGMVLVAAAGIPRRRTFRQSVVFKSRVLAYKAARAVTPEGPAREKLRRAFGSADYRASTGPLRDLLVRVIAEDLSKEAASISCPVRLIFGKEDKDTPPEIGERLNKLIKNSEFLVLDRYNHNSILTEGRHQLTTLIRSFVEEKI